MEVQVAEAALGFTVKSGWAAVVLLGGPAGSPRVLEADFYPQAAKLLRRQEAKLRAALAALSRPAGPWRAEQKSAALAAWLALAGVLPAKATAAARSTADHGDDA